LTGFNEIGGTRGISFALKFNNKGELGRYNMRRDGRKTY